MKRILRVRVKPNNCVGLKDRAMALGKYASIGKTQQLCGLKADLSLLDYSFPTSSPAAQFLHFLSQHLGSKRCLHV
ncbi:MAG: hypothetical protein EAY75_06000 [Bacteroidetes bacterium]|nr:MAG: hypothetical protein EAY75_06000 [Bacteroidota bacterium]